MRSKQISDTVFFKHKYITQPTLMQADTILKVLNDLTHTLKGRKNVKGDAQIKALEKINKLLNNISRRITTEKEKQVTFDETTAPPQKNNVRTTIPATKPKTTAWLLITKAIVDKPIPIQTPTPRVQVNTNTEMAKTPSTPRVHTNPKENILPKQMKLRHRIRKATTNQVRLPHHQNMQLHQQEQHGRLQLIRDKETGEFIACHPHCHPHCPCHP
jgi:hypothetical protein